LATKALRCRANLQIPHGIRQPEKICEAHLEGRYHIKVIDLLVTPQLARGDQILALPTLVRKLPQPMVRILGDLSNTERVLVGLDIRPLQGL